MYLSATTAQLFLLSLQVTLLCKGAWQYVAILNLVFCFFFSRAVIILIDCYSSLMENFYFEISTIKILTTLNIPALFFHRLDHKYPEGHTSPESVVS